MKLGHRYISMFYLCIFTTLGYSILCLHVIYLAHYLYYIHSIISGTFQYTLLFLGFFAFRFCYKIDEKYTISIENLLFERSFCLTYIFLKLKKSTNLLEILPKICFIRNSDRLALKLSFFEIFNRRKINKSVYQNEKKVNCIKLHKSFIKFSCFEMQNH